MRTHTHEDPWLLPSDQFDYPTREVLSDSRVHGRREGTFLLLVAMFLVSTIALPLLGATRVIDLSAALARIAPALELPIAMQLPLGVLVFPLGFVAIDLVCELYSRRRATALIWVGFLAMIGMLGLVRIGDAVGGGATAGFGTAVAFASCYLVAHLCNVFLFEAMRQRAAGYGLWWRSLVTTVAAQLVGWVVFAFVLYGYSIKIAGLSGPAVTSPITTIAVGAFAYSTAFALVAIVPIVLATGSLALYLRVGRFGERDDFYVDRSYREGPGFANSSPRLAVRPIGVAPVAPPPAPSPSQRRPLPKALIIESSPSLPQVVIPAAAKTPVVVAAAEGTPAPRVAPKPMVSERRAARNSIQPFNSAEMRFFTEGDELIEA